MKIVQSSHMPLTQFPVNIITYIHGPFITSKQASPLLNSKHYLDFSNFSTHVLFLVQNHTQDPTLHCTVTSP